MELEGRENQAGGGRGDAGPGLKILVAEDDRINRLMLKRFLEIKGHCVVCARNGREVLELLKDQDFDCVLMDIQMPELDGVQTARLIRRAGSLGQRSRLPIIAVTAHAMKGDREKFLAAGMDEYLAKPVDVKELDRILARICAGV
ncbi:MAG: response regulator [Desulfovibrionaceae bacterium]|nr:response regulator [Desulfovibrionaceae bacterium]